MEFNRSSSRSETKTGNVCQESSPGISAQKWVSPQNRTVSSCWTMSVSPAQASYQNTYKSLQTVNFSKKATLASPTPPWCSSASSFPQSCPKSTARPSPSPSGTQSSESNSNPKPVNSCLSSVTRHRWKSSSPESHSILRLRPGVMWSESYVSKMLRK